MIKLDPYKALGVTLFLAASLVAVASASAAERYKLANEGAIGKDWALADGAKLSAPGYPAAFADRGDDVCVALGYAINPDGTTSNFSVLKAWGSGMSGDGKEPVPGYLDAFVQAGANSVAQWKFKPRDAAATPRATYTVATLVFTGKQELEKDALRNKCAIADLANFVQEQKATAFMDGRERQDMERERLLVEQRQMERRAARLEQLPRTQ